MIEWAVNCFACASVSENATGARARDAQNYNCSSTTGWTISRARAKYSNADTKWVRGTRTDDVVIHGAVIMRESAGARAAGDDAVAAVWPFWLVWPVRPPLNRCSVTGTL